MNGRAHLKIAMLSYAIVAIIPEINSLSIFNNEYIHVPMGISIIGIGTAGIAGLIVDADSKSSKINRMNPIAGASNTVIGGISKILKLVLRVGVGAMILWYSKVIISMLSRIKYISEYAEFGTYFMAIILIVLGLTKESSIKKIPIIGGSYKKLSGSISRGSNIIRRATMFLTYAISSLILIIYNFTHVNDINLYIISILLVGIAIFPHRSFLHSIEGVVIFTISASYVFNRLGYVDCKVTGTLQKLGR